jgi:hypothetical protein
LFHFLLTAGPQDQAATIRAEIRNEAGNVVYSLESRAGQSSSGGSVLLVPGQYSVRFFIDNPSGPTIEYRLMGGDLSDPIGPVTSDPTLQLKYTTPRPPEGSPTPPLYTFPGFGVPFDPRGLPGYVDPNDPSTWPVGFVMLPEYAQYPWLIVTNDPFFWISLGL